MLRFWFIALIGGLFGAVIFVSAHNFFYAKSYGVVRVDDILAEHINKYSKIDTNQAQRQERATRFATALDQVIKQYSQDKRIILFVSNAVVTDLPDYTASIKHDVESRLQ